MEEQENLSNVLEINHQLPRAEGGNIGSQPECTPLVTEHRRPKVLSERLLGEGYVNLLHSPQSSSVSSQ